MKNLLYLFQVGTPSFCYLWGGRFSSQVIQLPPVGLCICFAETAFMCLIVPHQPPWIEMGILGTYFLGSVPRFSIRIVIPSRESPLHHPLLFNLAFFSMKLIKTIGPALNEFHKLSQPDQDFGREGMLHAARCFVG